ncbi:MAG: PQQ-binding-like beta-propeller repeat protein [Candidatus Falkowbacteria bacterium]
MIKDRKWKLAVLVVLVVLCLVALVVCWSAIFAFVKKTGGKLNIQQSEITKLAKCDIRTKFPAMAGTYQEFAMYDSMSLSDEDYPDEKILILHWFHSFENGSQGKLVALNLLTCETEWTVIAEKAVDNLDFVKFKHDKWNAQFGYLLFGKEIERDEAGLNGGFNGAELFKIDLYTGKVIWKYAVEKGAAQLMEISEKQVLLGVKKNFVLLDSRAGDNLIIAIDKESGAQLWKYKVKTNDTNWSFATDEFSKVFVPTTTLKLDINTGKPAYGGKN